MQLTFLGGTFLGLSPDKARSLHQLLSQRYRDIESDEVFSGAPSALAYCYAASSPESGFATIYVPDTASEESNVILFLHGYGGSFMFYLHYLAAAFPDHIIVCPAYGISCSQIPSAYLQECQDAVSDGLGFGLKRPVLIGLSAGGFGGFREYVRTPDAYAGFICLAAYPPKDVLADSPAHGRIRMMAGEEEAFVKKRWLRRAEDRLKQRTPDCVSRLIPNQGHFFMLGAEAATKEVLQEWDADLQDSGDQE